MLDKPNKTWWSSVDFQVPNFQPSYRFFIGMEATARMSDAYAKYGDDVFELQPQGTIDQYRRLRLRFERLDAILTKHENLAAVVRFASIKLPSGTYLPPEPVQKPPKLNKSKKTFKSYAK